MMQAFILCLTGQSTSVFLLTSIIIMSQIYDIVMYPKKMVEDPSRLNWPKQVLSDQLRPCFMFSTNRLRLQCLAKIKSRKAVQSLDIGIRSWR